MRPRALQSTLRDMDLNLLVYFDTLMSEGQVSRAAARLGISQPAMSAALSRLRGAFSDELFTKSAQGMVPTERARELAQPVADLLARASTLLDTAETTRAGRRHFSLMGTDYVLWVTLPRLVEVLRRRAPQFSIAARQPNPKRVLELLATSQVDLGIGFLVDPPKSLHSRVLYRERSVCIARTGHPDVGGSLSMAQYRDLEHVQITPAGVGYYAKLIESTLARSRVRRRAGLTVPNFLIAPQIVAHTDLIATVPERIARGYAGSGAVQVLAPPLDLPLLEISLYWHERSQRDADHRLLRSALMELAPKL